MNCPRCKSPITQSFDPDSIIACPGCGARLMTRAAALRSQNKLKPHKSTPPLDPALTPAPEPSASAAGGRATRETAASGAPVGRPPKETKTARVPSLPPAAADLPPSATLPPTSSMRVGAYARALDLPAEATPGPVAREVPLTELLLAELQQIRTNQEHMLALLRGDSAAPVEREREREPEPEPEVRSVLQPVRSRSRKSVLLIDDDPETRAAAVGELERADVPVRTAADGNEALRLIAEEKPDVIALELGLEGEMAGKDMINTIKATMEWVAIPVVLWTREPVTTQKEARLVHGADEVVQKESGPAALVTRVITLFRSA